MKSKGDNFTILGTSTHSQNERVKNDYYATDPKAGKLLLELETFSENIWECACGEGHMSEVIKRYNQNVYSTDLIYRGYGIGEVDFLSSQRETDNVITNPPFSLFQEFAQKALSISKNKVALFGKLQALEGCKRASFIEKSPLETVYVFKKRINPMRNGKDCDENGKKWASTMAFAWFVWRKGYEGLPQIKWL